MIGVAPSVHENALRLLCPDRFELRFDERLWVRVAMDFLLGWICPVQRMRKVRRSCREPLSTNRSARLSRAGSREPAAVRVEERTRFFLRAQAAVPWVSPARSKPPEPRSLHFRLAAAPWDSHIPHPVPAVRPWKR